MRSTNTIALILLLFFSIDIMAEEISATYETRDDDFNKVINDPIVQPIYEVCKDTAESNSELSKCIFTNLENTGQLEDIQKKYFAKDGNMPEYESAQLATVKKGTDQSIKNLEKYLYDRLQKALYGDIRMDAANKKTKVVDHKVFYDLYQNQVSKNIITSLSSYCIEADHNSGYTISADKAKRDIQRAKNTESLSVVNFSDGKAESAASNAWGGCITSLEKICRKSFAEYHIASDENDYSYSKKRACVLTKYIKGLRQTLIATEQIETELKKIDKGGGVAVSNVDIYHGAGKSGKSIDDLTSITSNEVATHSGFADGANAELEALKRCRESGREEDCSRFMAKQETKEKTDQAIVEYDLKMRMLKKKVADMGDEELEKFLLEEGRNTDEISRLMASDESKQNVKKKIEQSYEEERKAIIEELNSEVNKRTVASSSPEEAASAFDKNISEINKELERKADDYKQLVQFNNIVSGFIVFEGSDQTNVQSINRELSDSAYNQDDKNDRGTASKGDEGFNKLSEALKDFANESSGKSDADSSVLGKDVINEKLFNYDDTPKTEEGEED